MFPFAIGQCHGAIKQKVESNESCDKIENNYDVKGLMELIKGFSCAIKETKCECWTMVQDIRNVIAIRQMDNESKVAHHKHLVNLVKVTQTKWGMILPHKMAEDDKNCEKKPDEAKKAVRDKFLVCVLLSGLRRKKHGNCVNDLNNSLSKRCILPLCA